MIAFIIKQNHPKYLACTVNSLEKLVNKNNQSYVYMAYLKDQWHKFEVFFGVSLNKRWNKQSNGRWFGTPQRSCDVTVMRSWCLDEDAVDLQSHHNRGQPERT